MTSVSTAAQALAQVKRLQVLQERLGSYQVQITTGKKAPLFKGLGTDVVTSQRSRSNFKILEKYDVNIDSAERRIKIMLSTLTSLKQQASNISGAMSNETQEGEVNFTSISGLAQNTLDFVKNLVNQKDGERYVFAGADTLNQPLNDTGILDTYLQTNIDSWVNGTITTDQLVDSYRDTSQLTDAVAGYSAQLSSGNGRSVFVKADDTAEVDYTVLANDPGIRDVVVAMNMILKISETLDRVSPDANDPGGLVSAPGATQQDKNGNFSQMYNDLIRMIEAGMNRIETLAEGLGNAQVQINQIQETHRLDKSILQENIADVEDADINDVAVKLNALQVQLEASYRVTATVQSLTLANFL